MALFPVINPIGNGFIINGFLKDMEEAERKSATKKIIFNCLLIGVGSLVAGHLIVLLFGLAIPVIQVGGGIMISKTAWSWLYDSKTAETDQAHEKVKKIRMEDIEKKLFYPISFPITIGAGTISTIFTLMATTSMEESMVKTMINYSMICFAILAVLVILYVFLSQGSKLMKKIGDLGNLIITKLIAFITFCIGIQIIITGISKIFHIPIL